MNKLILKYYEEIEILLLNSDVIEKYEIIRQDISNIDGKIRIKLTLINQDSVDLFEYIVEKDNNLIVNKYHFHWQNKDSILICRWDNAPHHKNLQNFPHHLHINDEVESINFIPNIKFIIKKLEEINILDN